MSWGNVIWTNGIVDMKASAIYKLITKATCILSMNGAYTFEITNIHNFSLQNFEIKIAFPSLTFAHSFQGCSQECWVCVQSKLKWLKFAKVFMQTKMFCNPFEALAMAPVNGGCALINVDAQKNISSRIVLLNEKKITISTMCAHRVIASSEAFLKARTLKAIQFSWKAMAATPAHMEYEKNSVSIMEKVTFLRVFFSILLFPAADEKFINFLLSMLHLQKFSRDI